MLTGRPAEPADLRLVTALLIECDIEEIGEPDWTEEDQAEEWRNPKLDLARDTRLLFDGGRPVGYAQVSPKVDGLDYNTEIWVRASHAELERELLAFVEERARETAKPGAFVHAFVYEPNTARTALLRSTGYERARTFWRMSIELDGPVPQPVVPEGLELRNFREGDERALYEALHEAFRDHYRHSDDTFEEWRARALARADFDPGLTWLVTDGAETAAATIGVAYSDGTGWVRTLGVRRTWRGRGLGRALLLASFQAFARHGLKRAALGVDSENPTGATRLYESAGMSVHRRYDLYRKLLDL